MRKRNLLLLVPILTLNLFSCEFPSLTWSEMIAKGSEYLNLDLNVLPEPAGYSKLEYKERSNKIEVTAHYDLSYLDTYSQLLLDAAFVLKDDLYIHQTNEIEAKVSDSGTNLFLEISKYEEINLEIFGWEESIMKISQELSVDLSAVIEPEFEDVIYKYEYQDVHSIIFEGASEDEVLDYWLSLEDYGFDNFTCHDHDIDVFFANDDLYAISIKEDGAYNFVGISILILERCNHDGWDEAILEVETMLDVTIKGILPHPRIFDVNYEFNDEDGEANIWFLYPNPGKITDYLESLTKVNFLLLDDVTNTPGYFAPDDSFTVYEAREEGLICGITIKKTYLASNITSFFPHLAINNFFINQTGFTPTWPSYNFGGRKFQTSYYEEPEASYPQVEVSIFACSLSDITNYHTALVNAHYEYWGILGGEDNYYDVDETNNFEWDIYTRFDQEKSIGTLTFVQMY